MNKNLIKCVAIILKPEVISEFNSFLPILTDWLLRRKKHIYFLESEMNRLTKIYKGELKNISFCTSKNLSKISDLIITLGGDGTLIGTCRNLNKNSPPIFGVNMGKLGFITEFSKTEFYESLTDIFEGKYEIIKIPLYTAELLKKNQRIFKSNFMNDVVINKLDISRMFSLGLEAGGENVYNVSGDGLIVSSPIGSTAYSLAAGGPIIHPHVQSLVLTPICPHGLNHRPIVVPDTFEIKINLIGNVEHVNVTIDGQIATTLEQEDLIRISKNKNNYVKLIRNQERYYFHTLKEKFTHGRRNY